MPVHREFCRLSGGKIRVLNQTLSEEKRLKI
jgi:hypothetical protein